MKINRILKNSQNNIIRYLSIIISLIWIFLPKKVNSRRRIILRIMITTKFVWILVKNVLKQIAISKDFQEMEDLEEYIKLNLKT